jgi:hypothetical protein
MTVADLRKELENYAPGARVLIVQDPLLDVLQVQPSLVRPGEEVGLVVGYDERESNP